MLHLNYLRHRDVFDAELMHDYAPQTAQERLLVYEVAASWRRLEQVVGARRKSERQSEKGEQSRETEAMKLVILRRRAAASVRTGNLVELAPPAPANQASRPAPARPPDRNDLAR